MSVGIEGIHVAARNTRTNVLRDPAPQHHVRQGVDHLQTVQPPGHAQRQATLLGHYPAGLLIFHNLPLFPISTNFSCSRSGVSGTLWPGALVDDPPGARLIFGHGTTVLVQIGRSRAARLTSSESQLV